MFRGVRALFPEVHGTRNRVDSSCSMRKATPNFHMNLKTRSCIQDVGFFVIILMT